MGSEKVGRNKKRAAVDPSCHLRAREPWDSGAKTAAPNQVLQERVKTRDPSAEEAKSRPSCGLVLCNFLLLSISPYAGDCLTTSFGKRHLKMSLHATNNYTMRLIREDVNAVNAGDAGATAGGV